MGAWVLRASMCTCECCMLHACMHAWGFYSLPLTCSNFKLPLFPPYGDTPSVPKYGVKASLCSEILSVCLSRDFNKWLRTEQNEWIYTLKYVYIHSYVPVHLKSLKRQIFWNGGSIILCMAHGTGCWRGFWQCYQTSSICLHNWRTIQIIFQRHEIVQWCELSAFVSRVLPSMLFRKQ